MSSSRVQTTFTGPSTFWAIAHGLLDTCPLRAVRPKPPPMKWLCTVTLSSGSPVTFAAIACARAKTCVPTQISQVSGVTMHRAVHRLHRRVGEERQLVGRFDRLALRQRLGRIADRFGDRAVLLARGAKSASRSCAELTCAFGPSSQVMSSAREPLFRRPHVIADHGDEIVQHDDLPHAGNGLGVRCRRRARPCRRTPGRQPAWRTSRPAASRRCRNSALPLTLSGVSSRLSGLPINRKSFGLPSAADPWAASCPRRWPTSAP